MKSTIVLSEENFDLPETLREAIVKTQNKTFGASVFDPKDGLVLFDVPGIGEPESLPATKGRYVCCFGGEVPALDQDRQPWELLVDSKNNSVVAGFFSGDFSGERKVDSSHTPAFHAHEKLSKRLKSLFRMAKESVEDLYEECKSQDFKDEVQELITTEGTVVLHFCNNKVLWFTNHDSGKHIFSGGIASGLHGWEEPGEDEFPDLEVTPAKIPAPTKQELKSTTAPPKDVVENYTGPRTEAGIYAEYDNQLRSPESLVKEGKLKSWNHVKNWSEDVFGYVPEGMKEAFEKFKGKNQTADPNVKFPKALPKLVKAEARAKIDRLRSQGLLETKTPAEQLAQHFNKVDSKTGVVAKVTPVTEVQPAVLTPTISEKSVERMDEFKNKYMDKSLQVIESPNDFDETDYPTFLEKMGLKDWSQLYGCPLEGWQYLAHRTDLARLCMFSMIREIKRLRSGESVEELPSMEELRKAG